MSSALGIAATAGVLQQLLQTGLGALKINDVLDVTTTKVTCLSPERIDSDADASQLNLFLYQTTRNPGWANMDLPSRDSRGERVASPALAIDLHFLVTAYGVADFHAEVLLGAAMQILHETPGMGREAIRIALKPGADKPQLPKQLALAGLADQLEQLRVTPLNLSMDELSRLWSAIQLPMRPSAAYQVSVVLIEAPRSERRALPVTAPPRVYVMPLRQLRIDRAEAADGPGTPVLPATRVRLSGAQFKANGMRVTANGIDASAGLSLSEDSTLELTLQTAVAAGLRAGIVALQVQQPQFMGDPPVEHQALESNLVALVLNPSAAFAVQAGVVDTVVGPITFKAGTIKVTLTPEVGLRQRVRLLLNQIDNAPGQPPRAYTFYAPDGNGIVAPAESSGTVLIPFRQVAAGKYLARVQVDAGISPLTMGPDGHFATPMVQP
ncbi:DUF4255 domain-containing protein [Oxalobacteraceae bacterium]|nr:DUF4255 domain-containing protein [Oxalobacteraceae bacterium]